MKESLTNLCVSGVTVKRGLSVLFESEGIHGEKNIVKDLDDWLEDIGIDYRD